MRRLFLGEHGGDSWITAIDGPHGEPEDVARAAKLHREIFCRDGNFVMIEVHGLPDMEKDPPINERQPPLVAPFSRLSLLTEPAGHEPV